MDNIIDKITSKPHRATYTWAWEVIVKKYNDRSDQYVDKNAARFFNPWKAVQHGIDHYKGMCMVQTVLLHTDNKT